MHNSALANAFSVPKFEVELGPRVGSQPFYEAGSCQEEFGFLIGSPFYSSFHDLACASQSWSHSTVRRVSFWATSFSTQGCHEFLVISISFRTHPFVPLESDPTFMSVGLAFPLVLTSAITLLFPLR